MTIYPQPKPMPEPKEQKRSSLPRPEPDRELERLSRETKLRAGGVCEIQGLHHECSPILDAAHIFSRGSCPRLRLDPDNLVAMCRNAHNLYDRTRWFKPHFKRWLNAKFPGRYEALRQKAIREARVE